MDGHTTRQIHMFKTGLPNHVFPQGACEYTAHWKLVSESVFLQKLSDSF